MNIWQTLIQQNEIQPSISNDLRMMTFELEYENHVMFRVPKLQSRLLLQYIILFQWQIK